MSQKILVVGAFDFVNFDTGGQPVKTRELYYALQEKYGKDTVEYFETEGWTKNAIKKVFILKEMVRKSDVVIMLPAMKGLQVLTPLIMTFRKNDTKLFYDVVGGWLPTLLKSKKWLEKRLKKYNGIWVETSSMKENLEKMGFSNVTVVRNFKNLTPIDIDEIEKCEEREIIKLCTFSRVVLEKGIEDAIEAVKLLNSKMFKCELNIYGQIDQNYASRFVEIESQFPDNICYKGVASPSESVEVLKKYSGLLFPTYYEGEGLAGTIIDAFAAGIPIVATDWHFNNEFIEDGITGYLVPIKSPGKIAEAVIALFDPRTDLKLMRRNCRNHFFCYSKENVVNQICKLIEER